MDFSDLPSVSSILADPRLGHEPHDLVVETAREVLDGVRARLVSGEKVAQDLVPDVVALVLRRRSMALVPVINATGIVIHTNLGRAPLAPSAVRAVQTVANGYSNLELDLETGKRGGRLAGVQTALCALTGAEAAFAVNNNAAAVMLALSAFAQGKRVLVSRGELVEIGGSFRIPDVISAGGAVLAEVGTTNRTRIGDFEEAIDADVGAILRVHPSNFRIQGFTERASRAQLVALGQAHEIPVIEDLGSGLLGDGDADEQVGAAVAAGVDVVCFSGDKLLGGPQAGLLVGKSTCIAQMQRHPMARALRLDKLVAAALEATLLVYRTGGTVPVQAMLHASPDLLKQRAQVLATGIPGARVVEDVGFVGGGASPEEALPSFVVEVSHPSPNKLARSLRLGSPAIVARVARDALIIDPRGLLDGQDGVVAERVGAVLAKHQA